MKNHLQEIVLTNYLKQYETDVNFHTVIRFLFSCEELNEESFIRCISELCKKLDEVTAGYAKLLADCAQKEGMAMYREVDDSL